MTRLAVIATIASLLLTGAAHAQDELADLIQARKRGAALEMIAAGADVSAAQSNGTTPLHWAAYNGDVELARALLEHGAEADVMNAYGSSPLSEAVNVADVDLTRMLLEAGADPDSPNADGQTALMLAVRTGVVEVAALLVEHGADVNAKESWRDQTALMWAAAENRPEMAEFLIANGADVSVRARWNDWDRQVTNEPRAQYRPTGGLTPLLYAARSGCLRCAKATLEAGADIDLPNPDGVTPLMTAIDNYNFDTAMFLLEQGANPHVWDWHGRTALYAAVDMSTYGGGGGFGEIQPPIEPETEHAALDVARALLEAGVDPNIQLVLHRPDRAGVGRFVDDALRTGATPMIRAAVSHDIEAMELLLAHGAEVDLPNVMGVTPLMIAAGMSVSTRDMRGVYRGGDPDRVQRSAIATIEFLLDHGADIDARVTDTSSWTARIARPSTMTDLEGQTAIYAAAGWGWTDVVAHLIDRGARLDIVDARGKSPLDAARGDAGGRPEGVNEETASVIEQAMAAL